MDDIEDVEEKCYCSICDREIDSEDIYSGADYEILCGDCWDEYTFLCYRCESVENIEYRESVGSYFIIVNNEWLVPNIPVGVYESIQQPYCWYEIAGKTYFYEDSIKLITSNTYNLEGYPWQSGGTLCRNCTNHIKKEMGI